MNEVGGHLWFESTEGTGSTFFMSLRLDEPSAPLPV